MTTRAMKARETVGNSGVVDDIEERVVVVEVAKTKLALSDMALVTGNGEVGFEVPE
jgi:hypothetical protein